MGKRGHARSYGKKHMSHGKWLRERHAKRAVNNQRKTRKALVQRPLDPEIPAPAAAVRETGETQ